MDLPEVLTVRGNHERQLLELPRESMSASDRLALDLLGAEDRAWLRSLPARVEIVPGVLAFHGGPTDDLCYLLETVEPAGLREATDAEVLQRLGDDAGRYSLYLCGHTHLQRTRPLPDGSVVVNPGSLGWPAYSDDLPFPHDVEAGTPHARFAVLRQEATGWQVTQRAIEYDVEAAAAMAAANGRPDVVRALRTGRV
jgi:predicted phosphodiesterase